MAILLAGSTGLVGGHVARLLPAADLFTIGRRSNAALPGEVRQLVGPEAEWPDMIAGERVDVAICALGTTIRTAGSQAAFAAIDHDLVLSFAKAACGAGARQFVMVSSVGASARASNFYLKTKGRAEDDVRAIGYDRVDVMRPGLLRGERNESRPGERIAMALSPLTDLLTPRAFDKYRSVAAEDVARAIVALVGKQELGQFVHEHRSITALAG